MKSINDPYHSLSLGASIINGALSGFGATLIFTIIHHIFISNIWFSFVFMALAGIISGILIALSYRLLFRSLAVRSWLLYNSAYILMFLLLGLFSVLIFEPIQTMSELLQAQGPPSELINKAFPITIIFTLVFATLLCALFARKISQIIAVISTSVFLMLVLGLNVSVIGLVEIPTSSLRLIIELFLLIILIMLVYAALFLVGQKIRFIFHTRV